MRRKRIFNLFENEFKYMMLRLDGKKENTYYHEVHNVEWSGGNGNGNGGTEDDDDEGDEARAIRVQETT